VFFVLNSECYLEFKLTIRTTGLESLTDEECEARYTGRSFSRSIAEEFRIVVVLGHIKFHVCVFNTQIGRCLSGEKVIVSMLALGGFREGTLVRLRHRHVREELEKGIKEKILASR
jgi:hypothetical protein